MHVKLRLEALNFDDNSFSVNIDGFCMNNYIITSNLGFPIETIFLIENEKETELKIIIDSQWNELLFLEKPDHLVSENVHGKIALNDNYTHFYANKQKLEVYANKQKLEDVIRLTFISFNMFDDFQLPYILCRNNDNININPGMPVYYINNNGKKYIFGMISKLSRYMDEIHIIPYYVISKTLTKKNNNDIFFINMKNITKIGKNIINDNNYIYHKSLKIDVPLNTFTLLEGDEDKKFKVNNIDTVMEKTELILKNNNKLINDKNKFVITFRFLQLIQQFKPEKIQKIMKKFNKDNNYLYKA
jgi:hypothetical protein